MRWVDRGCCGQQKVDNTRIFSPKSAPKNTSKTLIEFLEMKFRKRVGIARMISHLKSEYQLGRNYLKGLIGDQINA
jgi:transposase, IS5 family